MQHHRTHGRRLGDGGCLVRHTRLYPTHLERDNMGKGKSIAPDPKKAAALLEKKVEKAENDLIKACKNDELSRAKKCAPAPHH